MNKLILTIMLFSVAVFAQPDKQKLEAGDIVAKGSMVVTTALSVGGATTLSDTLSGIVGEFSSNLTVTGKGSFGATKKIVIGENLIQEEATNGTEAIVINNKGYQGGATHFRNTIVANGKQQFIASFTGDGLITRLFGDLLVVGTVNTYDSLSVHREKSSIADDGEIVIATGVGGFGEVRADTCYAHFQFQANGFVQIISSYGAVSNTDADGNLCIYDAGTGIAIKNTLGARHDVKVNISY